MARFHDRAFPGKRNFELENKWKGRMPTRDAGGAYPTEMLFASTRRVHRFKFDELRRVVIATYDFRGGLTVSCMDTDRVLFHLPEVRPRSI